ncbi:hypothetical protein HMN09_00799200 [Mycena chlorophos]|uniref:P-loop containing nucleoside triphosphate hydrolase protein n=1 Tax=Mycena chlorophos TaxID=658473 RepID=A0A8H6SSV1_MYCCL|nr:hypothetical protein HMN09_00799200 [Mycena chlorophos]
MSFLRRGTFSRNRNNNSQSRGGNGSTSTTGGAPVDRRGQAGTSAIASGDYARRCRELMELSKDLRALGATKYIDLPSITVIGGQSAGKSSLVEAVSGITVPRDSGTCTRCPMEINMSTSAMSWSCKISLRLDHNTDGTEPLTVPFGGTITNRNEVELWLRRAQAAILSPHLAHDVFYTKTRAELADMDDDQRLKFSHNSIVVEVNDPHLTDLSFIDLPGLVQNDTDEVVQTVRNLVVSRIASSKTLILVTLPSNEDHDNQAAARLARDADLDGSRTIAVLTKVDMIPEGSLGLRKHWEDVLEGRKRPLKHGYYCVRLSDDAERRSGISRDEAERRATEFFDANLPWSQIADRSRFGVKNLATFLSTLLIERIEANLPSLRKQLAELIRKCTAELEGMPAPPPTQDATAEVLRRVTAFYEQFAAAVSGTGQKELAQKCRRHYRQFSINIRGTCPQFIPFVHRSGGASDYQQGPPAEPQDYDLPALVVSDDATADSDAASLVEEIALPSYVADLTRLRTVIRDSVAWELPTYTPFAATEVLVGHSTKDWREPSLRCFRHIVETSQEFLNELIASHFSQFSLLQEYIQSVTLAEINGCKAEALETLERILKIETQPLFTQNVNLFVAETKKWHAHYMSRRSPYHSAPHYLAPETDEYAEELTLMSKVRAYWQIAYQRVIDYIPLTVDHEFNQRLAESLHGALLLQLVEGENVEGRMKELLAEDPQISERRSALESRLEKLREIQMRLDAL